MNIRKFRQEDLETVLKLFQEVVHTVGSKYYTQEQLAAWAPAKLDKDKWLESLTANITYVAEDKSKIIGFGDMTYEGYIDRLYVQKEYQGKGIALALFNKLEEEAKSLGLKELTTDANEMGRSFAERQGFEVVKEHKKTHRGQEFINYLMRKKL